MSDANQIPDELRVVVAFARMGAKQAQHAEFYVDLRAMRSFRGQDHAFLMQRFALVADQILAELRKP